jgi:hypothetical protein
MKRDLLMYCDELLSSFEVEKLFVKEDTILESLLLSAALHKMKNDGYIRYTENKSITHRVEYQVQLTLNGEEHRRAGGYVTERRKKRFSFWVSALGICINVVFLIFNICCFYYNNFVK